MFLASCRLADSHDNQKKKVIEFFPLFIIFEIGRKVLMWEKNKENKK